MRGVAPAFLLALAAWLPGCARERPLRVGMAIPSYAHGVLWIAQDGGFFAGNGLKAEVFVTKGSADAVRLLMSGDLDIVLAGGDAVVRADLAGADVVAFAGVVNTFYHRIAAGPAVGTAADLRGRSIGLPFLGGPQDMTVRAALERAGLVYGKDATIRNMGSEYARLTAIRDGRADAVTTDAPDSVLRELGLRVAADVPSWKIPFPYMAAVARRGTLERNEDAAARFLRSLCEAMAFYRDRREESLAILAKRMASEPGTRARAAELYEANGPSRFTFPPRTDARGFGTILGMLEDPAAAARRPEEFADGRLLERLIREGSCR